MVEGHRPHFRHPLDALAANLDYPGHDRSDIFEHRLCRNPQSGNVLRAQEMRTRLVSLCCTDRVMGKSIDLNRQAYG